MIINDKEAATRLGSPMNLINKLRLMSDRKNNAMSLFGMRSASIKDNTQQSKTLELQPTETAIKSSFNPFKPKPKQELVLVDKTSETPKLDDISNDHDNKIKLSLAHDKALQLLTDSVSMLSAKLDDVSASKLPSVISAASKTVESIRRERLEAAKNNKDREVHYHFYTPQQKRIEEYEIIEVSQ